MEVSFFLVVDLKRLRLIKITISFSNEQINERTKIAPQILHIFFMILAGLPKFLSLKLKPSSYLRGGEEKVERKIDIRHRPEKFNFLALALKLRLADKSSIQKYMYLI